MPLPFCYEQPRPAITVDLVVFAFDGKNLRVLLVRRGTDPDAGKWALPGGFMEIDETLREGALRELFEETGLKGIRELLQLAIFDAVKRDPRGRVLSVAFVAFTSWPAELRGGDDAKEALWHNPKRIEDLAFDHQEILDRAMQWLTVALLTGPIALVLLPESFTSEQVRLLFRAAGVPDREVHPWLSKLAATRIIKPGFSRKSKPATKRSKKPKK